MIRFAVNQELYNSAIIFFGIVCANFKIKKPPVYTGGCS
jgi:hypothetical protein